MPVDFSRSDRKVFIWFGAVLFLLVVLVFFFTPEDEEGPRFPSTYSAHSRGAKAVFLVLQESGYKVERWTASPASLPQPGTGTLLILAEPALAPEKDEHKAIDRYIYGGGRVLAVGKSAAALLPRDDSQDLSAPQVDWNEISVALPSRITRGGAIKTNMASKWASSDAGDLVHYSSTDGAAVISYRYGAGEVIWWASATPLTNAGAQERGNLELLLNTIGDDKPKIYWDEFFHGQRSSLWSKVSDILSNGCSSRPEYSLLRCSSPIRGEVVPCTH